MEKLRFSEKILISLAVLLTVVIIVLMIFLSPINNTVKVKKILPATASSTEIKLININKADKATLMTLSGIGETTADNIIKYRDNYGEFKYKDDVMKVDGIGPSKYEAIKDFICAE